MLPGTKAWRGSCPMTRITAGSMWSRPRASVALCACRSIVRSIAARSALCSGVSAARAGRAGANAADTTASMMGRRVRPKVELIWLISPSATRRPWQGFPTHVEQQTRTREGSMPRFAANLSTMFTDRPFLERCAAARKAGFEAVECQFPYEVEAADLAAELAAHGLSMLLINTPPGDFAAGERGLAGLPGREADFRAALDRAMAYAEALDCPQIHVMAGVRPEGTAREACWATYKANLAIAAEAVAAAGPPGRV